jgi:AraC-like DNA-binding protein
LFESVERAVGQNLRELPTFSEIAKRLCLSERTLRRRLADNGVSYQELLDSVRKHRALEMLANPRLSFEQVVFEVGFCDSHNFRRALKRWTGSTPSEMR